MMRLLSKLSSNLSTKSSVERNLYSISTNKLFKPFPGVREKTISLIILESEYILSQLNHFYESLKDIILGMKFTLNTLMDQIIGISPNMISGIYTSDDILLIQKLYSNFEGVIFVKFLLSFIF